MNSLVVPPSPNWYNVHILACALDNTLIYGSKNDLVLIRPTPEGEPLEVKFIDQAHNQRVISVDVNIQWGSPNKWVLSSGEDNYVKLWNMEKFENIYSHDVHKEYKDKIVGAKFLAENRVLSVSENGYMYIWQPSTKECTKLNNFFGMKVAISCFSPCPHATFITAFGLKNGLIVVANLKKNGSLLYKLRGHHNDVVSLSWCPAPFNIFPSKPNNYIKGVIKPEEESQVVTITNENTEKEIEENDNKTEEINHSDIFEQSEANLKKSNDGEKHQGDLVEILKNLKDCSEDIKISDTVENSQKKIEIFFNALLENKNREFASEKVPDPQSAETEIKGDETTNQPQEFKKCVVKPSISITEEGKDENNVKLHDEVNISKHSEESTIKIIEEGKGENKVEFKRCVVIPSISITEEEKDENNVELRDELNISKSSEELTISIIEEGKDENKVELNDEHEISKNSEESNEHSSEECANKKVVEEKNITMTSKCSEEDPRKEYLLASSGKDNSIYIWRAGTDGRMQSFFKIPEKKSYHNKGKKVKDVAWVVLKWVTPFTLLTSTKKGEILKYTLPRPLSGQNQCTIVHNEHHTLIFSIVAHVPTLTAENWLTKRETNFWTFGHDMYLLNTVLDSKTTHLVTVETFCALINCLAQSPLDPSRVAFGLSNGTIKVWNTNEPHMKNFSTVNYSPRIHSKITCLAWHPTNELLLAFCTEEGTIGLVNTKNLQKATWFKQTFANTVHRIQWGPRNNDNVGLFAAGEGDLMCFNPDEPKSEPLKIKLPEDTYVYTFAWKSDNSLMLLVHNSGKMMILSPNFTVKAIYYQTKKLLSVTWHPDSECMSGEATPRSYWVAAALDNAVYIFDFAEVTHKNGTLDIQDITKTILKGHESNVKCLAWCPFNGDRLVSAGEDGLAHVWDVSTKQILASFYEHNFLPLKTIIWSPIQEETLICSATNASLIVWKMSDYPAPLSEDILEKCKLRLKNEKKSISTKVDLSADKNIKKIKKSIKHAILPVMNTEKNDSVSEKVKLLGELLEWKVNGGDVKINGVPSLKQLFGSKEDILKLLNITEASHIEKGKDEAASMVSFWKGDLQNSIKEAIDQRRVSPLLISLAPTVSLTVWQKACETYASQLEDKTDSDPLEIATYYMACQNIEKAITCLCEKEMFKEALCLAKCRLPEDNVFVEDIIQKWASFSSYCGSLETAAQCYIVLGKFEDAVKVLFRRSELDILNFALDLAKKSNNAELISAVEFRCKAFAAGDSINQEKSPLPDKKELVLETSNNLENGTGDEVSQSSLENVVNVKSEDIPATEEKETEINIPVE